MSIMPKPNSAQAVTTAARYSGRSWLVLLIKTGARLMDHLQHRVADGRCCSSLVPVTRDITSSAERQSSPAGAAATRFDPRKHRRVVRAKCPQAWEGNAVEDDSSSPAPCRVSDSHIGNGMPSVICFQVAVASMLLKPTARVTFE